MADLIRRRAIMSNSPPFHSKNGPVTNGVFSETVTDGKHFILQWSGSGTYNPYQSRDLKYNTIWSSDWERWFYCKPGDTLDLELKNIQYYNSRSGTWGFECNFRSGEDGTVLIGFINALNTRINVPAGTGVLDNRIARKTVPDNVYFSNCLRFWASQYNNQTLRVEFDLELRINNLRVI